MTPPLRRVIIRPLANSPGLTFLDCPPLTFLDCPPCPGLSFSPCCGSEVLFGGLIKFFSFFTRLQVPSHKLLWSFVDCLSVLPTLWRQFVQCKSNFYCSLPSEQCPDAVQRRFRFDSSALSGSSLGAVSIFFGAKFFFFR